MDLELFPFLVSAIIFVISTLLLKPFAINIDLVDKPNHRKMHDGNVPLIGGISIFIAIIFGALTTQIYFNQHIGLLLALTIVVIVGVFDDLKDLPVSYRVLLHIVAALIVVIFNEVVLNSFGWIFPFGEFKLSSFSVFITVFAIIGIMNAVNMSDGIDGLSSALSLVVMLFIAYFSYIGGNKYYLVSALLVCSVLVPFLFFNLGVFGERNKIFLGDAGTTLLGFIIAITLIGSSQGDGAIFPPVIALWLFVIPIVDTISIMTRRIIKGRSPFVADREHLHHFFVRSGYSDKSALVIIVIMSVLSSFVGLLMMKYNVEEWKIFVSFVFVFFLYFYITIHSWKVMKLIKR
jgi:UDP-GlcNAc:undecaprenyl-phosphate GlcNAc-1-phosphate transferase